MVNLDFINFVEMDFNFIKYIKDFMPYVMAKDKLVPKTIDNKDVIGKDMLEFVKVKYMIYISILDFNSIIKLTLNLNRYVWFLQYRLWAMKLNFNSLVKSITLLDLNVIKFRHVPYVQHHDKYYRVHIKLNIQS